MTVTWAPNPTAPLWYEERMGEPVGPFFHDLELQHTRQVGPSCVATTLSMVANATGASTTPEDFLCQYTKEEWKEIQASWWDEAEQRINMIRRNQDE